MDFVTVFDIAGADTSGWGLVAGIAAALLSVFVLGVLVAPMAKPRRRVFLGFALLTGLIIGYGIWAGYTEDLSLLKARASGDFQVVEGKVENFDERIDEDNEKESFSVAGVEFSYDGRTVTTAFNHTARNGGPIRPGAGVRISYVGDRIIKLEINRADIPDERARKAYVESPPMHALTEEERRHAELPLLTAAVLITLRIASKANLFIRAWCVFATFATGQTFRRSRAWDLAANLLIWLYLGGAVGAFTWSALNGMEGPYWDQLPPIVFFLVFYFLFMEGLARLALRLGRRHDPGPLVQ